MRSPAPVCSLPPATGAAQVTVVEATGVPRMDLLGKCDPYCTLWVRDSRKVGMAAVPCAACRGRRRDGLPPACATPQMTTAIKSRTLRPHWGESFTFLVHSAAHQELTLVMLDSGGRRSARSAGVRWWWQALCPLDFSARARRP